MAVTTPIVAALDADAPATRDTTSAMMGTNDALTIGQLSASAVRAWDHRGHLPLRSGSPRSSAYCSASQYTTSVTSTETARALVGRLAPAAVMIAAVMIAP